MYKHNEFEQNTPRCDTYATCFHIIFFGTVAFFESGESSQSHRVVNISVSCLLSYRLFDDKINTANIRYSPSTSMIFARYTR